MYVYMYVLYTYMVVSTNIVHPDVEISCIIYIYVTYLSIPCSYGPIGFYLRPGTGGAPERY
jgi:hypothetical protein